MRAVLRFFEVKARAACNDILLERDVLVDDLPQREHARLQFARSAGRHEGDVDHRNGVLQLGVGKQLVQNNLRVGVAANVHHDLHALTRGMVLDVGDAVDALVLDQVGHGLDQARLVDHVRDLGDLDLAFAVRQLDDLGLGAHLDLAAAGRIRGADAAAAHDHAAGREIRRFDDAHDLFDFGVAVFQNAVVHDLYDRIDHLPQVVGRDVCAWRPRTPPPPAAPRC